MIDFTSSSYLKLMGVPTAACSLVYLAYYASQGYHERNRQNSSHIQVSHTSGWHILRAVGTLVLLGVTASGVAGDSDIHGVMLCIVTVSDSAPRVTFIYDEYRDMPHY
jgi:hypothetical protein